VKEKREKRKKKKKRRRRQNRRQRGLYDHTDSVYQSHPVA
jgi:hypothetical protein